MSFCSVQRRMSTIVTRVPEIGGEYNRTISSGLVKNFKHGQLIYVILSGRESVKPGHNRLWTDCHLGFSE